MAHLALRLLRPLETLLDGQPVTMIKLAKARRCAGAVGDEPGA